MRVLPLTLLSGLVLGILLAAGAGAFDQPYAAPITTHPTAPMERPHSNRPWHAEAIPASPASPFTMEILELVWYVSNSAEQAALIEQVAEMGRHDEGSRTSHVFLITTPEEQAWFDALRQHAHDELSHLAVLGMPGIPYLRVIDFRDE